MEKSSILAKVILFLSRRRVPLQYLAISFFLVEDLVEGVRPHDIDSLRDPYGTLGLVLVLAGVLLRSWAAGVVRKKRRLAVTGPYSLLRHPLYLGSLLMALGFTTIIGDDENILMIMAVAFLLYLPKIRREELFLAEKFKQEWRKYVQRTAAFFPKKLPLYIHTPWSWRQWLSNHEYRAFSCSLLALAVLELWHELSIRPCGH